MAAVAVTVKISMRIVAFVSLKPTSELIQWKYASYLVEVLMIPLQSYSEPG